MIKEIEVQDALYRLVNYGRYTNGRPTKTDGQLVRAYIRELRIELQTVKRLGRDDARRANDAEEELERLQAEAGS